MATMPNAPPGLVITRALHRTDAAERLSRVRQLRSIGITWRLPGWPARIEGSAGRCLQSGNPASASSDVAPGARTQSRTLVRSHRILSQSGRASSRAVTRWPVSPKGPTRRPQGRAANLPRPVLGNTPCRQPFLLRTTAFLAPSARRPRTPSRREAVWPPLRLR